MAAHARQQYFADEESIQKQAREFSLVDELKDKLDSIEWGAQVNVIEEVKENGVPLEIVDKSVNVEVPLVIDNLYTIDPDNSLSAKQGKILYDLIQNLASRGRYLSNWNAATGLPMTNPVESPYEYRAGDYYIVSNVAAQGGTNYRPEVGQYIIGQASDEVEHETVKVTDMYLYDGTNWNLLINSTREIAIDSSLSTSSTNPVENRVVTNAINTKQDILIAGNNIQIASDGKTISSTDTTYTAGTNIQIDANNQISATDTTYTAGANIQIDANNQISATDTVYAEGTGIDITNNIISNEGVLTVNGDNGNVTVNDVKVSSTAPANPTEGMIWYDTTNDQLKAWDGTNWNVTGKVYTAGDGIAISAQNVISNTRKSVAVSQTAPDNPSAGDLWYNTTKDVMFLYDGSDWTIIGPEIYPITKADYDALSNAEKTDGRFFLITDNDGTIYVDWANVQNKPSIQGELTPGDGIDIDANNEISIDASDIVGTGLTEDGNNNLAIDTTVVATQTDLATKQDKFHTTSSSQPSNPSEGDEWYDTTNDVLKVYDGTNWIVTGKTYTAGDRIDITNNIISADKQFEVVDTLPSVSVASEDKVYILGPLNVDGADKYEEWIINDSQAGFVSDSPITHVAINGEVEYGSPYNWNLDGTVTNVYVGINNYTPGEGVNTKLDDDYNSVTIRLDEQTFPYVYYSGATYINGRPIIYASIESAGTSSVAMDLYYSDSPLTRQAASKQWTKIGETSVDLSNYLAKNNTTSYTPSGDYNPATKKYVDDNKGKKDIVISQTAPSDKTVLWFNADPNTSAAADLLYYNNYAGGSWQSLGGIYSSSSAPSGSNKLWYDTSDSTIKYYDNDTHSWEPIGGVKYVEGFGIDFSSPYGDEVEIAVDPDDLAGSGLSVNIGNGQLQVDTTVIQEKLTAGTGINISSNTISADTTVLATKSDIANLGSFTVVDTLPSVSSADEKTIYLLGPIGTGADKYEEWIVTNQIVNETFTAAGTPAWNYDPSHLNLSNSTTLTYISSEGSGNNGFILDDNLGNVYGYYTSNNIFQNTGWYQYDEGTGDWTFIDSTSVTVPAGNYELSCGGGDSSFDSITISTGVLKQWTKIGETSVDLSNYLAKNNTTAFTPTGNYNPATKKYVDDNKGKNDIIVGDTTPSDETVLWYGYSDGDSNVKSFKYSNNYIWIDIESIWYGSSAPITYDLGTLWYDTTNYILKYYDHQEYTWKPVGGITSSNNTYDNIIHLSQADYDNLQNKDPNTLYSTPDSESGGFEPENAGTVGQVLTKTATGYSYQNVPTELPSGGSNGQVLTKTSNGVAFQNVPTELPSGGTTGQVLTKIANGVAWQNSGGTVDFKAYYGVINLSSQGSASYTIPNDGFIDVSVSGTGLADYYNSFSLGGISMLSSNGGTKTAQYPVCKGMSCSGSMSKNAGGVYVTFYSFHG